MFFLKKLWDPANSPVVNHDEEEQKEREELGINQELILFVDNISKYPETFKDFPFQTLKDKNLKITRLQKKHIEKILGIVKPLNDLRYQLCPSSMTDEKFWKIYFTHISKVTNVKFNATESTTTSTPSVLDDLDSQFDKLSSAPKKPFDQGIDEDEDSYFTVNTYLSNFLNNSNSNSSNNSNNMLITNGLSSQSP